MDRAIANLVVASTSPVPKGTMQQSLHGILRQFSERYGSFAYASEVSQRGHDRLIADIRVALSGSAVTSLDAVHPLQEGRPREED